MPACLWRSSAKPARYLFLKGGLQVRCVCPMLMSNELLWERIRNLIYNRADELIGGEGPDEDACGNLADEIVDLVRGE